MLSKLLNFLNILISPKRNNMRDQNFFCFLSIIPVRAEASDASEMVTQMLFGELGVVLEVKEQWLKIRSHHDQYEGFIDFKQVLFIKAETKDALLEEDYRQSRQFLKLSSPFGPIETLKGSRIKENEAQLKVENTVFNIVRANTIESPHANVGDVAMEFINAPYLWGGRTKYGIDCSGFTQVVLRAFGIELLRDASQQVTQGKEVNYQDLKVGDLAFFSNSKGNVTHVGIILEGNKIIHASGRVKIETLDEKGIYSEELNKYTHQLTHLRRYLN